jgi:hypothetical protein
MAGVSAVQGYLIQRPGPASALDFDATLVREEAENAENAA